MDVAWIQLPSRCLLLLSVLTTLVLSHKEKPPLELCGQREVCRTSMKYKDKTVHDEGLLCKCGDNDDDNGEGESNLCPKDYWTEDDGRTLTWQHYERAHWFVQYRFCTDVFDPRNLCAPGTLAAVVETDVKAWHPQVSKPRCVCKDGESYKLMKWVREGKMWRYYYYCEKPECAHTGDPSVVHTKEPLCAKIYVNPYRNTDMVNEVRFLCNCPRDFLCDAKFDEKEDIKDIHNDSEGKYVIKRCEPIVRKKKDAKKQ